MARRFGYTFRIVTLEDLLNTGGAMSGGGENRHRHSYQEQEIGELDEELITHAAKPK